MGHVENGVIANTLVAPNSHDITDGGKGDEVAILNEVDVDEEAVARAVVQVKQAMAAEQAAARQLVETALCPRAPPNPPEGVRRPPLRATQHISRPS